jgi:hypothetical protein
MARGNPTLYDSHTYVAEIKSGAATFMAVQMPISCYFTHLPTLICISKDTRFETTGDTVMHKVGAIPFEIQNDRIALLFVTSQRRGRWIFPKGGLKTEISNQAGNHKKSGG